MPVMRVSMRATSNPCVRHSSTAASPLSATLVTWPARLRIRESVARMFFSSSTMSTLEPVGIRGLLLFVGQSRIGRPRFAGGAGIARRGRLAPRQAYAKRRSALCALGQLDRAAVLVDDQPADYESQAGSLG